MRRFLTLIFICALCLCGCRNKSSVPTETTLPETSVETFAETTAKPDYLQEIIDDLPDEQLVGQLFLASTYRLEDITPGGIVLFASDLEDKTPQTLRQALNSLQKNGEIPIFFAVDEEGGTVTRVSQNSAFRATPFPSPKSLYAQGGLSLLLETEKEKATLLRSLGIHVNLAPVCDITTEKVAFMYQRSLGLAPDETALVITEMVKTASENKLGSVLKHFPGYGNNTDTHIAMAVDNRSLEELESQDLLPFQAGMDAGCGAVMVTHTVIAAIDDTAPATLSPAVHDYLRSKMGFDGVIITDDMVMDAISQNYGEGEAAVLAILAGNDMICTSDCKESYRAVLDALRSGRISRDRVESSVYRILQWKENLGILG